MEDFTICKKQAYLDSMESFTTRDPTSSSFKINFNCSCKPYISHYILHEDYTSDPEFVRIDSSPKIDNSITFTLQEFLSYKQSRETIKEIVKNWPVRSVARRNFIHHAFKRAREAIISMPARHNVVSLEFKVRAIHEYYFDGRRVLDRIIQRSMEENEAGMVPAVDWSIEALETKILVDHGTCSICLEEFSIDGISEGVCMPCKHKHIFHGDCIQKWLKTSHYCPICRFEMPTS
ncbi:hypothetical protein BUALT_Bualt16G0101200 [Buddleja alternifolia]|uniref:RING-type E3 ubiquitin transferase n=1 Tax=Buddleja alternifolia TaxID=168488 RepID=A0AAV6WAL2_9LAMI|nr:hypothetical protein BUALT_Bualt16G0101200 [Buddleja alternifolia]